MAVRFILNGKDSSREEFEKHRLNNWEKAAGTGIASGVVAMIAVLGKNFSHWWLIPGAITLLVSSFFMWRIKRKQKKLGIKTNNDLQCN